MAGDTIWVGLPPILVTIRDHRHIQLEGVLRTLRLESRINPSGNLHFGIPGRCAASYLFTNLSYGARRLRGIETDGA